MSSRNQAGPNALPVGENGTTLSRRRLLGGVVAGGVAVSALATPALAQNRQRWTMVTSWAKGSAGPGGSADRIAAAITAMSGGRLEVLVRGAGELVSPFGVWTPLLMGWLKWVIRPVSSGQAACRQRRSSPRFLSVLPLSTTMRGFVMVVGKSMWTRAYDDYGLLPRLAGNSDMTMAGWSRRPCAVLKTSRA